MYNMKVNDPKDKFDYYVFYSNLSISEIEIQSNAPLHECYPKLERAYIKALDSKDYKEVRKVYNEICTLCEKLEGETNEKP